MSSRGPTNEELRKEVEFAVVPYVVIRNGIAGAEGRIVVGITRAIIRLREPRGEPDDATIDALLKKAEQPEKYSDELWQMLGDEYVENVATPEERERTQVAKPGKLVKL